jgi:hypothetical protein
VPASWHRIERRRAGQVGSNDTLPDSTDSAAWAAVSPSWHGCQVGAKNLAQVPFSLARDNGCPVPDKLAVATWALSRSWHNFTLRRAGERGSKTVPSPGAIRGDLLL